MGPEFNALPKNGVYERQSVMNGEGTKDIFKRRRDADALTKTRVSNYLFLMVMYMPLHVFILWLELAIDEASCLYSLKLGAN